uniref:Clp protease ATP binding subunit n=1 Tax=Pteridomonas sp. YPF1301 TaxID=2766739 RepID=A0A7G1MQF1_9STRA|nr:Clp protease ATP binding subunit [Pteridomonas sp. YPF1301]
MNFNNIYKKVKFFINMLITKFLFLFFYASNFHSLKIIVSEDLLIGFWIRKNFVCHILTYLHLTPQNIFNLTLNIINKIQYKKYNNSILFSYKVQKIVNIILFISNFYNNLKNNTILLLFYILTNLHKITLNFLISKMLNLTKIYKYLLCCLYLQKKTLKKNKYFYNIPNKWDDGLKNFFSYRTYELKLLVKILKNTKKKNIFLIGNSGIGKQTLIQALPQYFMNYKSIFYNKNNKKFFMLNFLYFIFLTRKKYLFMRFFSYFIFTLNKTLNKILCIKNFAIFSKYTLIYNRLMTILNFYLNKNRLQCIILITNKQYKVIKKVSLNKLKLFYFIKLFELTISQTFTLILKKRKYIEFFYKINILNNSIKFAIDLRTIYNKTLCLPANALKLLIETCSFFYFSYKFLPMTSFQIKLAMIIRKKEIAIQQNNFISAFLLERIYQTLYKKLIFFYNKKQYGIKKRIITKENIYNFLKIWTGLKLNKKQFLKSENLVKIEKNLKHRIIGQDYAIFTISNSIKQAFLGLNDKTKPLRTFLFCGSTGVGKTELAKALTFFLFGSEKELLQFNMSEYSQIMTILKLIGIPLGYIQSSPGLLITKLKRKPYAILLFTQIEKAHRIFFKFLFQCLNTGYFRDTYENLQNFTKNIMIFTSNVGSKEIKKLSNKNKIVDCKLFEKIYKRVLKCFFVFLKQKIVNSFDKIILFKFLTFNNIYFIMKKNIKNFINRFQQKKIIIAITRISIHFLASCSFYSNYGAYLVNYFIIKYLEQPLLNFFFKNKFHQNHILIYLNSNNKIIILGLPNYIVNNKVINNYSKF